MVSFVQVLVIISAVVNDGLHASNNNWQRVIILTLHKRAEWSNIMAILIPRNLNTNINSLKLFLNVLFFKLEIINEWHIQFFYLHKIQARTYGL